MKKLLYLIFFIASAALGQVPALNDLIRANPSSPSRTANALDALLPYTASGTDTYTVSLGLGIYSGSATYEAGDTYKIIFTNANTVTTPTINGSGEGAKTIVKNDGTAVAAGDVKGILIISYDGTNFRIVGAAGGSGGGGSGTVTSVGFTLGTSGTDAGVSGSPVTTSGSITLNLPSSSASNRGLLTSADWSTFNGKSPLAGSASLTTTGTLTTGATGTGFTLSFTNSTLSGRIAEANIPAAYVVDVVSTSTAGGTITLDMNSQKGRFHVGSATFSAPKTLALSNTTNAIVFNFKFNITDVAAVLTLPSDWSMSDLGWNGTTWTPSQADPGGSRYEMAGSWDSVNSLWDVKIKGPFIN